MRLMMFSDVVCVNCGHAKAFHLTLNRGCSLDDCKCTAFWLRPENWSRSDDGVRSDPPPVTGAQGRRLGCAAIIGKGSDAGKTCGRPPEHTNHAVWHLYQAPTEPEETPESPPEGTVPIYCERCEEPAVRWQYDTTGAPPTSVGDSLGRVVRAWCAAHDEAVPGTCETCKHDGHAPMKVGGRVVRYDTYCWQCNNEHAFVGGQHEKEDGWMAREFYDAREQQEELPGWLLGTSGWLRRSIRRSVGPQSEGPQSQGPQSEGPQSSGIEEERDVNEERPHRVRVVIEGDSVVFNMEDVMKGFTVSMLEGNEYPRFVLRLEKDAEDPPTGGTFDVEIDVRTDETESSDLSVRVTPDRGIDR